MTAKPKTPPTKSPVKKTTRAMEEYAKLQHEADIRLQHLRSVLKDVARAYVANLEQQIIGAADRITTSPQDGKRRTVLPGQLTQIIEILDAFKVKPEKGRRKEFKKIEIVVDTINKYLPAAEE
jgi:hypothetical protein